MPCSTNSKTPAEGFAKQEPFSVSIHILFKKYFLFLRDLSQGPKAHLTIESMKSITVIEHHHLSLCEETNWSPLFYLLALNVTASLS